MAEIIPYALNDTTSVADSAIAEADTIVSGEEYSPITLQITDTPVASPVTEDYSRGMSWVYAALFIIVCAVCFWIRNKKMLAAVLRDLTEVRLRPNAFDETAHETGFMLLLNLQWVATAGIVLWLLIGKITHVDPANSFSLSLHTKPALTIALCCAATAIYEVVMFIVYNIVGIVFTNRDKTKLWTKGYGASQALTGVWLLCTALPGLFYPAAADVLLILSGIGFVIGKIIFIFKGFRIFFTQMSSWILFLYYLCSLEIIPLILTLYAAIWLCSLV